MRNRYSSFFSSALFLLILSLKAQPAFIRNDSVPVIASGKQLGLPWSGGLNFCQFSNIDLDQDGVKDLFVFDRCSPGIGKISPFLIKGTPGDPEYRYAPQYRTKFPLLNYWVLLADYNCDGKEDLFTSAPGGMAVYKNTSGVANGLQFTLVIPLLNSNYNPTVTSLYVTSVDIPTIADLDNDGDLDILTFGLASQSMEHHKNFSVETYGNCDSLVFRYQPGCWGKFAKDVNDCSALLNQSCRKGIPQPGNFTGKTCSACPTCSFTLDMDADGDKEIVLGDFSCSKLNKLTNGGSPQSALMVAQDLTFPSLDTSTLAIDLVNYPCGYYTDVDNDTVKDLLVSPNTVNASNNFTSIVWYKNKGLNTRPVFEFQKNNFLQDEMIETGEGAYPAFFDENGDGLRDLIIGNYGYYSPGNYKSQLSLYRNTGTASVPAFELVTRDYAGLSASGLLNIAPAFGDMDGDGDDDMLLGDSEGKLHYFPNTAGAGNPAAWGIIQPNYEGIDIGNYAFPQIVDVDRDGKNDLLIGSRNGRLGFYKNIGTVFVPSFTLQASSFGGVDVSKAGFVSGFSYPFLFEEAGNYKLMLGTESGWVYLYDSIDGNLAGNFRLLDSMFQNLWEGPRSSVHGADVNNDGHMDLLLGNYGGGVSFYTGADPVSVKKLNENTVSFSIFPNPASEFAGYRFEGGLFSAEKRISMFDLTGKRIFSQTVYSSTGRLEISGLDAGVYIIMPEISEGNNTKLNSNFHKLVIVR